MTMPGSSAFEDLSGELDTPDEPGAPGIPQGEETQRELRHVERVGTVDHAVEVVLGEDIAPAKVEPAAGTDDENYSRGVRERIARERRVTQRERQRGDAAEQRAAALERENLELRGKAQGAEIGGELVVLNQQLKAARADADTDKETEILAKIAEAGAKRAQRPVAAERPAAPLNQNAEPNELLDTWLSRNPWFNAPQHAAESSAALAINAELYNAGYDEHDPLYYKELDRRLKEKVKVPGATEPAPRQRSPVASGEMGAPAGTRSSNGNRVVITAEDKASMRKFKMDPSNAEHLKQWAKQKQKLGIAA